MRSDKPKLRRLTFTERVRVVEWMKEKFPTKELADSFATLAERAVRETQIGGVTRHNIQSIAEDFGFVSYKNLRQANGADSEHLDRIRTLRYEDLRRDVNLILRFLDAYDPSWRTAGEPPAPPTQRTLVPPE